MLFYNVVSRVTMVDARTRLYGTGASNMTPPHPNTAVPLGAHAARRWLIALKLPTIVPHKGSTRARGGYSLTGYQPTTRPALAPPLQATYYWPVQRWCLVRSVRCPTPLYAARGHEHSYPVHCCLMRYQVIKTAGAIIGVCTTCAHRMRIKI